MKRNFLALCLLAGQIAMIVLFVNLYTSNVNTKDEFEKGKRPLTNSIKKYRDTQQVNLLGGMKFDEEFLRNLEKKAELPLIPHILHQTWENHEIPEIFVPWLKSLWHHHPSWEHWLWTDEDLNCYFKKNHPEFQELFNDYPSNIYRADMMRYFILYDFGGFYLDMDVEALQPLDPWTYIASSILSHETYEHSFMNGGRNKTVVLNAVMASKAKHPYYKLLHDRLQTAWNNNYQLLDATGPYFITDVLTEYKIMAKSVSNNKWKENDVLELDPIYWLPTVDYKLRMGGIKRECNSEKPHSTIVEILCKQQKEESFSNLPKNASFLNHHWIHTYLNQGSFGKMKRHSIFNVKPNFRTVKDILKLEC